MGFVVPGGGKRLALVGTGSVGTLGKSPVSSCFKSRNKAAASRIRLNSMQKACTSMNSSWTLIILLRIKDWRKTHNSRTNRFWMYLSLMDSQV